MRRTIRVRRRDVMHYTGRQCKGGKARFRALSGRNSSNWQPRCTMRARFIISPPTSGGVMKLTPNKTSMGVRIDDIDLSKSVSQAEFATILAALGKFGVICFPKQTLDARALKAFSERFGSLQGSPTGTYCEPGVPEVMLLSNIIEDGKPIGLADAGQDWHTDMSYNAVIGFTNVLYGIKIPHGTASRSATRCSPICTPPMMTFRRRSRRSLRTPPPRTTSTSSGKRCANAPARRALPSRQNNAPRARLRCTRFSSRIRSPAGRCSTPILATRYVSMNWTKRRAT